MCTKACGVITYIHSQRAVYWRVKMTNAHSYPPLIQHARTHVYFEVRLFLTLTGLLPLHCCETTLTRGNPTNGCSNYQVNDKQERKQAQQRTQYHRVDSNAKMKDSGRAILELSGRAVLEVSEKAVLEVSGSMLKICGLTSNAVPVYWECLRQRS